MSYLSKHLFTNCLDSPNQTSKHPHSQQALGEGILQLSSGRGSSHPPFFDPGSKCHQPLFPLGCVGFLDGILIFEHSFLNLENSKPLFYSRFAPMEVSMVYKLLVSSMYQSEEVGCFDIWHRAQRLLEIAEAHFCLIRQVTGFLSWTQKSQGPRGV